MPTESESSFKSPIRQLTDGNYPEWLIDIKAHLRKQKLWKYTQETAPVTLNATALVKWNDSSTEAADTMTPTISNPVKQKLQASAFDCGFQMMTQLTALFAPKGDAEFMRLTKEYYSLRFADFDSITSYLTQIKTLEERIRGTKVILDDDKQTLLCLGMTLPEHLQYFTKLWAMTPGMTADRARNMLLEEERRTKESTTTATNGVDGWAALRSQGPCTKCGKNHSLSVCWKAHPELAPEWLQEKWTIEKRSRKRKFEDNEAAEVYAAEVYCQSEEEV